MRLAAAREQYLQAQEDAFLASFEDDPQGPELANLLLDIEEMLRGRALCAPVEPPWTLAPTIRRRRQKCRF